MKLNHLLFAFIALFIFSQCKNSNDKPSVLESAANILSDKVILDTFADIQILRYELPGFDQLSIRQKTLIYYLSEAAAAGRDIIYDQHCKYNLAIRKTNEAIYNTYKGDRNSEDWKKFDEYAKRVWFSNGIHHHYNETKIMPRFSMDYYISLIKACDPTALPLLPNETANNLMAKLVPVIFEATNLDKRTNKAEGVDVVKTSAVNFYDNITAEQVDKFYQDKIKAAGKNPPMFGLNSKLINTNTNLVEQVWRAGQGNMYGTAIDKIVYWLEKATNVAENENQKKAMLLLIEFYKTGDLKKFDEYNIAWVKDTESTIDFINGFIETYHDPKGYKGDFEANVQYNDPDATKKMAIVSANAQYFEDNSCIRKEHKKAKVTGVSYRVINVAYEGGDCAPSTPIGINLPNSNWIRELGSKSVSLNNIENAYSKAGGAAATVEFANDPEEVEISKKYGEACGKMHTALHEVIGHASGKMNPGIPEPNVTLKQYAATLEEGRADLVALYYMPDPKLIEFGLMPNAEAYKAEYDSYIRNGMLTQLRRIKPGNDIEEDHMRNRLLVSQWAIEKGQKDNVITKEVRNGKTYYDIKDYAKLRVIFGQLLTEIQRIKSEGDFKSAKAMVEKYAVKVPAEMVIEVRNRFSALPTKPFGGFVQPRLVPTLDANGNVTDVKVEIEYDFVKQMLRFGKEYSFLPTYN
jgi:dipeptidyl-peptidase III